MEPETSVNIITTEQTDQDEEIDSSPSIVNTNIPWDMDQYDSNLQRTFDLGTFSWPSDHLTRLLNPRNLLGSLPSFKTFIKNYSRYRYDMEITFHINPTISHHGLLCLAQWMGSAVPTDDEWCYLEHRILSAGNPEKVTINLPWREKTAGINNSWSQRVSYRVLTPLRHLSTSTPSLKIHMTVKLTNFVAMTYLKVQMEETDKETEEKSSGKLSNVAHRVNTIASVMRPLPVVGGIASAVSEVASFSENLFKYFGWTKPTTVEKTLLTKECSYAHMVNGRGIAQHVKMGMDQTAVMADDRETFREDYPVLTMKQLCLRPRYVSKHAITPSTGTIDINVNMPNWINMFRSYRGSHKFLFYFSGSVHTDARIMFSIGTSGTDGPHMYVDISGDTVVKFSVPYTGSTFSWDSSTTIVRLTVVNPPSAAMLEASTTVDCALYHSFGEDTEFYQFLGVDSTEDLYVQFSPNKEFEEVFEGLAPMNFQPTNHPLTGSVASTIKEILMTPVLLSEKINVHPEMNLKLTSVLQFLGYFAMHRVNLRITVKSNTAKKAWLTSASKTNPVMIQANPDEDLTVEIPLTDMRNYWEYYHTIKFPIEATNASIWVSISDDSSFGSFKGYSHGDPIASIEAPKQVEEDSSTPKPLNEL